MRSVVNPLRLVAMLMLWSASVSAFAAPRVITSADATAREQFVAERLRAAVAGLPGHERILLGTRQSALLAPFDKQLSGLWPDAKEAFALKRFGNTLVVAGFDPSGVLYGGLELTERIQAGHALPTQLDFIDHPQLKIRGAVLGLQRPELTYENAEYDYRYTPQEFPWFYDKAAWTVYLDQLVAQRTNALFLWSGHPFTSLLRLPRYPEAQELPNAQLEQNIAMYRWLTAEADKRGIWVLQGFYNIHLSHNFARAHGVPFHLSAPTPLSSEYTRYCISEFIREYPNVGLFMTLGEAMGPHYGADWLTKTIIPGVKDGLAEQAKAVGHPVPEPPIIVRAHATDIDDVMKAAKPLYSNIDTMWKWNGESLTWTNIRGSVKQKFQAMIAGSNITVVNIHLLSNLEPFRWGDPQFIQATLTNFIRIGLGGVHVYPLRYWEWPNSADKSDILLHQPDRDWIWFAAWARYAWNPERDPAKEQTYWATQFAERFGVGSTQAVDAQGHSANVVATVSADTFAAQMTQLSPAAMAAGQHLLAAYELAGPCAPRLLPRVGITEGNRQVLSLGMTMPQLIDAARFNPAATLWTGDAPDGERLDEWVANEVHGVAHHGESPLGVAAEVAAQSAKAVTEAEAAAPGIAPNAQPEYARVVNDMRAIAALMAYYSAKTQAAALVMRFGYDHDRVHLQAARAPLAESVMDFARLTALTETTYRDAAGMETSQRQIPVRGGPDTNHWRDLLPVYQKELTTFDKRLVAMNSGNTAESTATVKRLQQVPFTLTAGGGQAFPVSKGESLYEDAGDAISTVTPELEGLKGIRVSEHQATPIHFTLSKPAQILVGYFKSNSRKTVNASPDTEQWNLLLPNAVTPAKGLPLSVWAKPVPAGLNDLDLGKGTYVVLGFIPEDAHVIPHVAFDVNSKEPPNLDWLFEN